MKIYLDDNLALNLDKGKLIFIEGRVGTGKSNLINTILHRAMIFNIVEIRTAILHNRDIIKSNSMISCNINTKEELFEYINHELNTINANYNKRFLIIDDAWSYELADKEREDLFNKLMILSRMNNFLYIIYSTQSTECGESQKLKEIAQSNGYCIETNRNYITLNDKTYKILPFNKNKIVIEDVIRSVKYETLYKIYFHNKIIYKGDYPDLHLHNLRCTLIYYKKKLFKHVVKLEII